ncbi:hypothetical protein BGW38_000997 [Lunasporangiospora selenospora]|uniref:F-box domain-containing protein n=1 Tax=Lunasporangiospora selenospora TaxID=979761 RepID=A0A9P6G1N5_9FUNG|nr:hypothetical protein BGW38_000997 [Lunasporangiospora selenospora]
MDSTLSSRPLHPLLIPELLFKAGQLLDLPSVIRCLRVCRLWQATLEPLIWEVIAPIVTGYPSMPYAYWPPADVIPAKAHLIRCLLRPPLSELNPFLSTCTGLTRLDIDTTRQTSMDDVAPLVQQNYNSLRSMTIKLDTYRFESWSRLTKRLFSDGLVFDLPNLESFSATAWEVRDHEGPKLLQMMQRLKDISLDRCSIPDIYMVAAPVDEPADQSLSMEDGFDKQHTARVRTFQFTKEPVLPTGIQFKNLEKLQIEHTNIHPKTLAAILTHSPRLWLFSWQLHRNSDMQLILNHLLQDPNADGPSGLSTIVNLHFVGRNQTKDALPTFLQLLTNLHTVSFHSSDICELGVFTLLDEYQSCKRSTLIQYLDLTSCNSINSGHIAMILTGCSALVGFQSSTVAKIRDMRDQEHVVELKPWVCLNLEVLSLSFDVGMNASRLDHQAIYNQLARLTKLKRYSPGLPTPPPRIPLKLSFKWGLDRLKVLPDLEIIGDYCGKISEISEEDLLWIRKQWPYMMHRLE